MLKTTIKRLLPVLFLIPLSGMGQILMKKGVANLSLADFKLTLGWLVVLISNVIQNFWLMLGLISFGTAFLIYLFILSRVQLNAIYPVLTSGTIVFVTVVSRFLFQEYLSLLQLAGISFVILGIFLMFFKRQGMALKNS